jgi:hypothetical protein
MLDAKIKKQVQAGICELIEDDAFVDRLGNLLFAVVQKALEEALTAEINFVDGKGNPGRAVERTEKVNMIAWLAKYIPEIEGRLLGVQADAAAARNRSAQVRDMIGGVLLSAQARGFVEVTRDSGDLIQLKNERLEK